MGLPQATPGGIKGNPDIVIIKDQELWLLELTTQKAKSSQETSETFSIIRHLRNFEKNNKELLRKKEIKRISLIYSAPILYEDLIKSLTSITSQEGLGMKFFKTNDLAERFSKNLKEVF